MVLRRDGEAQDRGVAAVSDGQAVYILGTSRPVFLMQLAAGIPGARLVVFDASGHNPFIEEADGFWRVGV